MAPIIHPNPVFEGSEKRIEIDFRLNAHIPDGLRALARSQLDELMTAAVCTIISSRENEHFAAYVLSESSLFVYPTKWVLKTCGTTKLLNCVPLLLEYTAQLGMTPVRVKFTRGSFLFPEQQLFPHTSFDEETSFLRDHFGSLGRTSAYVLGDKYSGLQWHVFVADADPKSASRRKRTYSMEVAMTELSSEAASRFFRSADFVSSEHTTLTTGIANLMPGAVIDDYVFDPCGYSMNGLLDTGFMTIHVTPEDGFSYASVELSGFAESAFDVGEVLAKIVRIFEPKKVGLALSVDTVSRESFFWSCLPLLPDEYGCAGASCHECTGGRVSYYSLFGQVDKEAPGSPVTVLQHAPSLPTVAGSDITNSETDEDSDVQAGSGGRSDRSWPEQAPATKLRMNAFHSTGWPDHTVLVSSCGHERRMSM